MTRNYTNSSVENARIELGGGAILTQNTRTYGYEGEQQNSQNSYNFYDVVFDGAASDIAQLAALVVALKNLPEVGAFDMDAEKLEDFLKEWASELAEGAEVPFTFTDSFGKSQTYTPASLWEASGGCEWEESAQYGYHYGWNL